MTMFWSKHFLKTCVIGALVTLAACAASPHNELRPTAEITAEAPARNVIDAVLGVISIVPETARTAEFLGTRRLGSGVLIDDRGLVLTIGYLIMEAETAAVIGPDGEKIAADVVAFDHETGFGLLRARKPIAATPLIMGDSRILTEGTRVLAVSHGGHMAKNTVIATRIVSRRPFAGYWEYLLEDAIFASPPLEEYGGAALINSKGHLIGIGSLLVNDAVPGYRPVLGNMFVPVYILEPLIDDLLTNGRRTTPNSPWLGVRIEEAEGRVFVSRLSAGGPGETAGLMPGDVIIGVNGKRVSGMEDYLRRIRNHGRAGDDIPLDIVPRAAEGLTIRRVVVPSIDRNDWLN